MPEATPNPSTTNLTAQTFRAAKWAYLSTIINAGLQVLVTAILARLLVPEAFGLVTISSLVIRFGQYLAQMGVGQAIVQRQNLHTDHIRAGFWISALVGSLFFLMVWFGAPLVAIAFDTDGLTSVMRGMGATFFISGLSLTALGMLRRQMRFKEIAVAEVISYALGYGCVGITLAFLGKGVWTLVGAAITQAALTTIIFNLQASPKVAPVLRWRPYRELLGFGSSVSVISFLEFANANLDTVVVGRLAGPSLLGIYNKALNLTSLPMQYMSTSLARVLLPSFSRVQTESSRLRNGYLSVMTIFAGIGLPIALGMSGAARELVSVLLGDQWTAAVPVMRLAAVAAVATMLSHFGGITLEATAKLRDKFLMRLGQLCLFVAALFSLGRFGLMGFAGAYVLSSVVLHIVQALRVATLLQLGRRELLAAYWPGLLGGVLALGILWLESWLGARWAIPSLVILGLQILTGMAIVAGVVILAGHGRLFLVMEDLLRKSVKRPVTVRALDWVAIRVSRHCANQGVAGE